MRRTVLAAAALLLLAAAPARATFTNPVLPGDQPDPTVLRAGGWFYASATVSAWAPLFPVFRSRDLVSWEQVGGALRQAPPWASGKFWAPELVRAPRGHPGYLLYYSAARVSGRPCIGVASAARAAGPYRDRGPAACPPSGAIDAAPVTDEHGRPWLGWKALGAGGGIHLQRLRSDGLRAHGPAPLVVAPTQGWERGVTEGGAFLRDPAGGWLLLYAGGGCCRPPCGYAEGAARAPRLTGPWTKEPEPFLTGGGGFKCPGHGTPVDLGARGIWLLHHAYLAGDRPDLRRSGLLTPLQFGADGWPLPTQPQLEEPSPLGGVQRRPSPSWSDGFPGGALAAPWQWLFDRPPAVRVSGGALRLDCAGAPASAPPFVARQAVVDDFAGVAEVRRDGRASPFVAVHDQRGDLRGIAWMRDGVRGLRITRGGAVDLGPATAVPAAAAAVDLVVTVAPGGHVGIQWRVPGGGQPAVLNAGPAASGPGALRLALGCWGHGTARFGSARLRALAAG